MKLRDRVRAFWTNPTTYVYVVKAVTGVGFLLTVYLAVSSLRTGQTLPGLALCAPAVLLLVANLKTD